MFKTKIAVAIAMGVLLTGCEVDDSPPSPEEENAYVDEQAAAQVRQTLASDQQDLKDTIAELQKKDPSVKDAYYSYNEKGEKELHVVKETANGQNSDMVWPLLGGMATGYLLAKAMTASGGMSQYSQSHAPTSQSSYAEDERRRRQNTSSSAYNTMMMNNARSSVRSSPSFGSSMKSATMTSRSSGVMSGSGARASSHGSSSGS